MKSLAVLWCLGIIVCVSTILLSVFLDGFWFLIPGVLGLLFFGSLLFALSKA
jgi:hypothetical protein